MLEKRKQMEQLKSEVSVTCWGKKEGGSVPLQFVTFVTRCVACDGVDKHKQKGKPLTNKGILLV